MRKTLPYFVVPPLAAVAMALFVSPAGSLAATAIEYGLIAG